MNFEALEQRLAALEVGLAESRARTQAAEARAQAAEVRAQTAEAREEATTEKTQRARGLEIPPLSTTYQFGDVDSTSYKCESPSKGRGVLFQNEFSIFSMDQQPHVPELIALSQVTSLAVLSSAGSPTALLSESKNYPLATAFVPTWVNATHRPADLQTGAKQAKTLFGYTVSTHPTLPTVSLPWSCFPELLTAAQDLHPAFNGELKSAVSSGDLSSPKLFDELVTYVVLGMVASLYRDAPPDRRRFFQRPPVGYGLVGLSHVGYLVAIEWIGKMFVSVVSQPFFLGSPEHEVAIAKLPDFTFVPVDVDIINSPVRTWGPPEGPVGVRWGHRPRGEGEGAASDFFFKVISCGAYPKEYFERMFAAYTAYERAWSDAADPAPTSLVPAMLLFGAGEVCVTMPWVKGRDGRAADLRPGGCAVEPVARAIAWLARHGLLYTDLREANVRVDIESSPPPPPPCPRVVLVDYDDVLVVASGGPVTSFAELRGLLLQADAPWAGQAGPEALPCVMRALEESWLTWGEQRRGSDA